MNVLPPEIEHEMNPCEMKGDEAAERGDLEYALDLYEDALTIQPENISLRGKLRRTQVRAHALRNNRENRMLSTWVLIAYARLKTNPMEALQSSERLMRRNPFNRKVFHTLLAVADKTAYPDIAMQALEILLEADPESEFLLRIMADRKRDLGDVKGEYECLSALAQVRPTDTALTHRLKDAAARTTMLHEDWKAEEANRR